MFFIILYNEFSSLSNIINVGITIKVILRRVIVVAICSNNNVIVYLPQTVKSVSSIAATDVYERTPVGMSVPPFTTEG